MHAGKMDSSGPDICILLELKCYIHFLVGPLHPFARALGLRVALFLGEGRGCCCAKCAQHGRPFRFFQRHLDVIHPWSARWRLQGGPRVENAAWKWNMIQNAAQLKLHFASDVSILHNCEYL